MPDLIRKEDYMNYVRMAAAAYGIGNCLKLIVDGKTDSFVIGLVLIPVFAVYGYAAYKKLLLEKQVDESSEESNN
jgi:hypothetical protein